MNPAKLCLGRISVAYGDQYVVRNFVELLTTAVYRTPDFIAPVVVGGVPALNICLGGLHGCPASERRITLSGERCQAIWL